MCRGVRVASLPPLEPGERVLFALRSTDLDQGVLGGTGPGWLHPGRFTPLLLVMRRPGRVAQTLALVPKGQLQQRVDRSGLTVDLLVPVGWRDLRPPDPGDKGLPDDLGQELGGEMKRS